MENIPLKLLNGKNILEVVRYTNKSFISGEKNFEFKLNEKYINRDDKLLKYIK